MTVIEIVCGKSLAPKVLVRGQRVRLLRCIEVFNAPYAFVQTCSAYPHHTTCSALSISTWDNKAASASLPASVVDATETSSLRERPVAVLASTETSSSVSRCNVCFVSFFVFWRFLRLAVGTAFDFPGLGFFLLLGCVGELSLV